MKRLFPLINIVLVTVFCFLSVDTAYKIFAAQLDTADRPEPILSGISLNPPEFITPPLSSYKAIVERDIFKTRINGAAAAKKIAVESIKPTEKNLKLWGTVVANDPARAYAIIEEPSANSRGKNQILYRNGDTVQGAEIKKILREKIILTVNGQNEILRIVKPQSSGPTRRTGNALRQRRNQPIHQRRILRSSQIQKAVSNIDKLMSQANIRPHPEGFQIFRIKPSSIFRRMGLRNGDIITAADSRPINSVDDAMNIWQDLTSGGKTSLEIKRRGRTRIIDYRIR